MPARRLTADDILPRFWARVERGGEGDCWLWTGETITGGYGVFWPLGGRRSRRIRAHRFAWELEHGPIPAGLVPHHTCHTPECEVRDNAVGCIHRRCVNPRHIELITNRENIIRGNGWAGRKARQTHCVHGHPLSGENLYIDPNGRRQCRTCHRRLGRQPVKNPHTRSHCIHGHLLSGENLYVDPTTGQRVCRECKRESGRRRRSRS